MIKVKNFTVEVEGNFETVSDDIICATSAFKEILMKTYGFDKKKAIKFLSKCVKTEIETASFKEVLKDE